MQLNDLKRPCIILPAILYFPLLGLGYLIIDIFHTEIPDEVQSDLQTTEYLNAELPTANICDLSVMKNIETDIDTVKMKENVKSEPTSPTRPEAFDKVKRWFNNAASFFSDIFTKGAVRVYIVEQSEENSNKKE